MAGDPATVRASGGTLPASASTLPALFTEAVEHMFVVLGAVPRNALA
jgi:hypothetical protein